MADGLTNFGYLGKNGSGANLPPCGNLAAAVLSQSATGADGFTKIKGTDPLVQCVALAGRRTVNTEPLTARREGHNAARESPACARPR